MAYEFRFPDVGEGITEGEVLTWKVHEGDLVAEDEALAEMETDKAVVDLPSPRAGRVVSLHAAEGDIVKVGDVLVTIEESAGAKPAPEAAAPPAAAGVAKPVPAAVPPAGVEPSTVEAPASEPPAGEPKAAAPAAAPYTGSVVGVLEEAPEELTKTPEELAVPPAQPAPVAGEEAAAAVLAMPSVRVLAGKLGVDLAGIRGTGPSGRVLKQDVEDAATAVASGGAIPVAPPAAAEAAWVVPLLGGILGQDSFGVVETVAFRGVRRTMARHMAESVAKQAQVTTMDEADVSIIKRIREKERTVAAERGVRLTYLAFMVKACTASLKRFPRLNAVLQESGEEFVLKRYYNIGIAIDTKEGLVVPNIKDADKKSIFQIADEIVHLVDRAEERRLDVRELHGGTFTITNYGAIGSTFATPVTNYPEVAILGMGRVRELPVVRQGKVVNRLLLPLSLTIDHQLIDGAEAARFLNLVIGYVEDPDLLLLEGA
jgi:pyruvate dehydrogenase E2 component (dihydrolipoamide acetyltransferase)